MKLKVLYIIVLNKVSFKMEFTSTPSSILKNEKNLVLIKVKYAKQ